jgi:hypothetical protein
MRCWQAVLLMAAMVCTAGKSCALAARGKKRTNAGVLNIFAATATSQCNFNELL